MDEFLKYNTISELISCVDDAKTKEQLEAVIKTALLNEIGKDTYLAEKVSDVLGMTYDNITEKIQRDVRIREELKAKDKGTKVKYVIISDWKVVAQFIDIFELREVPNPVTFEQFNTEINKAVEKKNKTVEWKEGMYDISPLMAVVGDGDSKLKLFAGKNSSFEDFREVLNSYRDFGRYGSYMIFKKISHSSDDPYKKFFEEFYEKIVNPHGITFRGPKSYPSCKYEECHGFYVARFECRAY